jgi:tetratricopeptide (TPR) repeat protein
MKKFLVCILICAGSWTKLTAQEEITITKENLLILYRNAHQAERNGNLDEAISIYKSILFIDDAQSTPYLKMANLYAADQSNAESVSLAITLYQKYLELDPNNRNAATVHNQVAQLQTLMEEKKETEGWQAYNYNITEIIQSNQEETRDIIVSTVHPALKAATKEEIVQAIDDINVLWNNAQEALNRGNDEAAIAFLNQLLGQVSISHPLYVQANMMLAQIYGNQGEMQKMQEVMTVLENNMELNKNLMQ